jgi:hypothetical protein
VKTKDIKFVILWHICVYDETVQMLQASCGINYQKNATLGCNFLDVTKKKKQKD